MKPIRIKNSIGFVEVHALVDAVAICVSEQNHARYATLSHSEARELAMAILALIDGENPYTAKETTKDKAMRIMIYAQKNQIDCPSVNDMVLLIEDRHPMPYPRSVDKSKPIGVCAPYTDWIEAVALEFANHKGAMFPGMDIEDIKHVIRKHAPKS